MKKLFFFLALATGIVSAEAQISGMSVTIEGSTTGTPLTATAAVSSNFNGYGVSCAIPATGLNTNGTVLVSVTGGSANYTYDLFTGTSAGTIGTGNAGTTGTATVAGLTNSFPGLLGTNGGGTSYTTQVRDNKGCMANFGTLASPVLSATVVVTAPADLTASLSTMVDDKCQLNAGSITVNVVGGVVNTVTPGATTSNGVGAGYDITWTASGTGPGAGSPAGTALANTTGTQVYSGLSGNSTYTFVVTDDNGCIVQ